MTCDMTNQLSDHDLFDLSATFFHMLIEELLRMKKQGVSYADMRNHVNQYPHMHPKHFQSVHFVINEWSEC